MLDRQMIVRDPEHVRRALARRGINSQWHYHVQVRPNSDRVYEGIAERCPLCQENTQKAKEA